MSISDPLSSGLLFRTRPRRSPRTPTSSSAPHASANPSLHLSPQGGSRRSSLLSSLPPSARPAPASLRDLVEHNVQPLAVRAATAALHAAQLEQTAGGSPGSSALRAAQQVYSEHGNDNNSRFESMEGNECRRLFLDDEDSVEQHITRSDEDQEGQDCLLPPLFPSTHEVDELMIDPNGQLDNLDEPSYVDPQVVDQESVNPDGKAGDFSSQEGNILKDSLRLTPRRSARRLPVVEEQASHHINEPAVDVERVTNEPARVRIQHRSVRRRALLHGVPSVSTRPLSAPRPVARPVVVKEESEDLPRRASAPVRRKPKKKSKGMSEVLRLQKSLETAQWTDSRDVCRQTEVIIISDDEAPSARAKAVLQKRKALMVSAGKAGARENTRKAANDKEESTEGHTNRALRSSSKKSMATPKLRTLREPDSVAMKRPRRTREGGNDREDKRDEDAAEDRTTGLSTRSLKANVSRKNSLNGERTSIDRKARSTQNKDKQKNDQGERRTPISVAGQKRKTRPNHVIAKRVRLVIPSEHAEKFEAGLNQSNMGRTRTSPRRSNLPNDTGADIIAKSLKAARVLDIPEAVHNKGQEVTTEHQGPSAAAHKRTSKDKRPKKRVEVVSPIRKVDRRRTTSPRNVAIENGRLVQEDQGNVDYADMEKDRSVKRRRKSRPKKQPEGSSDLLAEIREDLRRSDATTLTRSQSGKAYDLRKHLALKDNGAHHASPLNETEVGEDRGMGDKSPSKSRLTTKRGRSLIVPVRQEAVENSWSISDLTAVETKAMNVRNESNYSAVQPPPKRRGKEKRRIQPIAVEVDIDTTSPERKGDGGPKLGSGQHRNSNQEKPVDVKVPQLRPNTEIGSSNGSPAYVPTRGDAISEDDLKEELSDGSEDEGITLKMDAKKWQLIAQAWNLECKARRSGLGGLGDGDMEVLLRGPFGLGDQVVRMIPELAQGSPASRSHGGKLSRNETPVRGARAVSDAERTESIGLSDEEIVQRTRKRSTGRRG